jgi:ribulose 1,5-bisphosphate carboxylase large subunit-like protein
MSNGLSSPEFQLRLANQAYTFWVKVEEQRRDSTEFSKESKYDLIRLAKKRVKQSASDIAYFTKLISEKDVSHV